MGRAVNSPQNINVIRRVLAGEGFSPMAIAASLARFSAESRFDPNALNIGDGADGSDSIGINQWNSGRARNLKAFARKQGTSANDVATQALFYAKEVKGEIGGEGKFGKLLLNARTPEEAAAGAISLARPKGWTAANPAGGLGYKQQLAATRAFASGNFDAGIPGKGRTLTGATASPFMPADDRGLMQGSKSRGRLAEEGETEPTYDLGFDSIASNLAGNGEGTQTPLDTSPEARMKNIVTGFLAAFSAGAGDGKDEDQFHAKPQLTRDISGPAKESPGFSSILGSIKSMAI